MKNIPFTILTQSGFRYDDLKRRILRIGGKILGRKIYGPMSVFNSLSRGLNQLNKNGKNIIYNINPPKNEIHETVIVIMLKDTLNYALSLKKKGIIKKIFAGPAISVPINNNDIFFHQDINSILVPSQRTKDYFLSLNISNPERVTIRPSGVENSNISKRNKNQIIIFKKTCPEDLYISICDYLNKLGITHITLHYGSFQFSEYQKLLTESCGMIYLQESETQGIALQEAWIRDIPTLVRDRGYRTYDGKRRWDSKQISCPWMTNEYGLTFDESNYENKINEFLSILSALHPSEHLIHELTDLGSTKLLLHILSNQC